jgi:uncharacterized OB-fold protein
MPDDAPPANPPRAIPQRDRHNRAFWEGGADGRLMITRCSRCTRWVHPPDADCPHCGGDLIPQPVSGHGTVFTYTINYQPFHPAVPVPYAIAIVELAEQDDLRLAANIIGCELDSVRIGLPVQVRFERYDADDRVFVPVFAPRPGEDM